MADTETETRVQVWFRNPDNYIREVVEAEHRFVIWDRGYLFKKKIDPVRHADLYFAGLPWRMIDVGNEEQGAAEYAPGSTRTQPVAVYPVVSMLGEKAIATLEELAANPSGESEEACFDTTVPPEERPVLGQDHIIIVTDLPDMSTGRGRAMIRSIRDVQLDYPDATIHIHGLYSFKTIFGFGFKSVDFEPRTTAQKGAIVLPVGREIKYEAAPTMLKWVQLLDFKPKDLTIPRNRCIYNIKSALWAARFFTDSLYTKFRRDPQAGPDAVDLTTPDANFKPVSTATALPAGLKLLPSDKITCGTCSLTSSCKAYREGAVCSLDKPNQGLAAMFQTRDSGVVIDGLSRILTKQAERVEQAMEDEEEFQELSPDVTKMLDGLFKNGMQYAKLIDPTLRSPKLAVNVNGAGSVTVGAERTPQQVIKDIFSELESQGFKRDEITPKMIETMLLRQGYEPRALGVESPRIIEAG